MQDPNENTEWNEVLRRKGVIPQKEAEITEEDVINLMETTIKEKTGQNEKAKEDLTLDELDELEDEEDERVLLEYRMKRIAEMKASALTNKFGEVREISAEDYIQQVNKAGEGIYVILHLYRNGIPLCTLINQFLHVLAAKFPATKFLRSISTTCIPNFPDKNLPTIFIYKDGEMVKRLIGPETFNGMNLKLEGLEWILGETGAVKTDLESDPRPKVKDVLFSSLRQNDGDSDENDW